MHRQGSCKDRLQGGKWQWSLQSSCGRVSTSIQPADALGSSALNSYNVCLVIALVHKQLIWAPYCKAGTGDAHTAVVADAAWQLMIDDFCAGRQE